MSKLRFHISMSLDGFVSGPNQSEEHPLGEGGMQLHEWVIGLAAWRERHGQVGGEVNASTKVVEGSLENIGATVMGRNMFGGEGPWGHDPWDGWWATTHPFAGRFLSSPTIPASPSPRRGEPPSPSLPTASNPPSSRPGRRPAARTSPWVAGRTSPSST